MAKSTAAKVKDTSRASVKQGGKKGKAKPSKGAPSGERKTRLRSAGHARSERRFTSKASAMAVASALATSIGGVCAGAGFVGQFFIPYKYAPWLLGLGALLAVVGFLSGSTPIVLRVGELGIGIEKDANTIERMAWHEVDAVRLASNTLSFSGRGRVISIPLASHPGAGALALAEARARIPARLVDVTEKLPFPTEAGELINLDPMQLAGLRCKASDRIIAVEKDGRYCGQCGQAYHREEVPEHCLSCDARLT